MSKLPPVVSPVWSGGRACMFNDFKGVCRRSAAGTDVAAHLAAIWYLYWKWASFSKTSIERQISVRWWVASKQWVSWRWLRSPACQFTDDCAASKGSVYHIRHSLRNNVVCFKKKTKSCPSFNRTLLVLFTTDFVTFLVFSYSVLCCLWIGKGVRRKGIKTWRLAGGLGITNG